MAENVLRETKIKVKKVEKKDKNTIVTVKPAKNSATTYEYIAKPIDKLEQNIIDEILSQLENTPVVIEPIVQNKLMCMIASVDGKLEIYGKMIVDIEQFADMKYPIVKDILIPYQNVASGSFESNDEQMAKFMFELNKDEHGNLKPIDEVNNITKRMLGHFHSHDSVGGCSPSLTDTKDMIEHVNGRKFWIEIIGTKKELKARIALSEPFNVIVEVPVIVKWWSVLDDVIHDLNNKITEKKYFYNDTKNKKTKSEKGSQKNYDYDDYDGYDDEYDNDEYRKYFLGYNKEW